jgi:putative ABC transport system permease protein
LENPIGKRIPNQNAIDHEIIGVVKDFHFASLHSGIDPLVMAQNVEIGFSAANNVNMDSDPAPKVFARLAPNNVAETIDLIKKSWIEVYGDEPFDYSFIDAGLQRQYVAEQNLGKIVSSATIIAMIIGIMGLFALATLTMNARVKEISVRKVLGAPMKNIIYLLSKSYVVIVIIALLISVPMTIYFAKSWLSEFEYRVDIGMESFLLAGLGTLLIALLTISIQCLKVAKANPAQTLSAE